MKGIDFSFNLEVVVIIRIWSDNKWNWGGCLEIGMKENIWYILKEELIEFYV